MHSTTVTEASSSRFPRRTSRIILLIAVEGEIFDADPSRPLPVSSSTTTKSHGHHKLVDCRAENYLICILCFLLQWVIVIVILER
jgi:hypothetical protein